MKELSLLLGSTSGKFIKSLMSWYVSWYYVSSLGAFRFQACGIAINFVSYISTTLWISAAEGEMNETRLYAWRHLWIIELIMCQLSSPLAAWWTKDWKCTRGKEGVWMYGDDCTGIFVMGVCRENICRLYHVHCMIHASSIPLSKPCCFIFSPNICSLQT